MKNVFLVRVQYTSMLSLVVAPCGEKFDLISTFPIKVSCRVVVYFSILGILKNFFFTVLFVMCWSFTSAILMPNIIWMLRFSNTSSFFRRDVRSPQLSHTHSNRFMGMARKIRYLLLLLTLASVQNLARAPIDAFPADRRTSMS